MKMKRNAEITRIFPKGKISYMPVKIYGRHMVAVHVNGVPSYQTPEFFKATVLFLKGLLSQKALSVLETEKEKITKEMITYISRCYPVCPSNLED